MTPCWRFWARRQRVIWNITRFPHTAYPMRIGCPVNIRRESESGVLGNRVSMMFPELQASRLNVEERLRAVTREDQCEFKDAANRAVTRAAA